MFISLSLKQLLTKNTPNMDCSGVRKAGGKTWQLDKNLPSAQISQKKVSILFMPNAILFTDTPIVTPITIPAPHAIMSCTVFSIHFVKKFCLYTHQS